MKNINSFAKVLNLGHRNGLEFWGLRTLEVYKNGRLIGKTTNFKDLKVLVLKEIAK